MKGSFSLDLLSLLLFISFSISISSSQAVPAVFFFGDSILDAGTNVFVTNCTIQANFQPYGEEFFHYPTGRFTNGRTIADFISEELGMDLQRPFLEVDMLVRSGMRKDYPVNGINFASAGSGVLEQTDESMVRMLARSRSIDLSRVMGVIPLQVQLQQFEDLVKGNKINKSTVEQALYVFQTGSNDVFFYFYPTGLPKPNPDVFVSLMAVEFQRVIQRIYNIGARRIAILGLGPVGCIPARLILPGTTPYHCFHQLNEMAVKYNTNLEALVNEMPTKLRGSVAVFADTFDVAVTFLKFPLRYGFTNVSSACCGQGALRGLSQCGTGQYELCKHPEHYLFWDFFHPTEHAYRIIFNGFWNGDSSRIRPLNLKSLVNLTLPLT